MRRWGSVLIVGLLSASFLSNAPGYAQRTDETIVVDHEAEVPNLDPAQSLGLHSLRVTRLVNETLVVPQPTTTEVMPWLATGWTVSPDGLQWTFTLRQNVRFQDGTPFDANAVKYTYDRVVDPNHPAHALGAWSFLRVYLAPIKSIEVVNPQTVRFHLKEPNSALLTYLSIPNAGVISPAAQQRWGKEFASHPVGTGPYTLKSWERGVRLILERNDEYWGAKGKAKTIVFRPVPEDQTRISDLLAGGADVILPVLPDAVSRIEHNPSTGIVRQRGLTFWYVALNLQKKPFDNVKVRRALNYAVNKEAIVRDVLKNTGVVATEPLLPSSWGYAPNAQVYPYDPAKAKALLHEAGYPAGFSATFWVPDSGSGMQLPKEMSTVIQANLAAIGVQAKIQVFEWGSYLGRLAKERPDMAALSWFLKSDDPDVALYPMLNTRGAPLPNVSHYSNPEVDRLLQEARATADRTKRATTYRKVVEIANSDAPWILIDHEVEIIGVRSNLVGLTVNPNGFYLGVESAYHR